MSETLNAGEICTRTVIIAFRQTALDEAANLMRANHVGCLVVVDQRHDKRCLVGLLTDRDIVTATVAANLSPHALRVEDVMTTDLVVAHEEMSLIDLIRTMRSKGVRRVPVVGLQDELIGIVSFDDVLGILVDELDLLVAAVGSEGKRERVMRT